MLGGIDAGAQRAQQLAARNHVGAQALACQRRQHRGIGIGLDRVGDQRAVRPRGDAGQRLAEHASVAVDRRRGIAT